MSRLIVLYAVWCAFRDRHETRSGWRYAMLRDLAHLKALRQQRCDAALWVWHPVEVGEIRGEFEIS